MRKDINKKDINLRPGDFRLPAQIFRLRLISFLAAAMFFALPAAAVLFSYIYRGCLESRIDTINKLRAELVAVAGVAEEMERGLQAAGERVELEKALRSRLVPWTGYINDIEKAAEGLAGVSLVSGTAGVTAGGTAGVTAGGTTGGTAGGTIMIDGTAASLEKIVLYTQSLAGLDYLHEVNLGSLELIINHDDDHGAHSYGSEGSQYIFTVTGQLAR